MYAPSRTYVINSVRLEELWVSLGEEASAEKTVGAHLVFCFSTPGRESSSRRSAVREAEEAGVESDYGTGAQALRVHGGLAPALWRTGFRSALVKP